MSLQLAAQHLADQGRGPDTTLVHMGEGEVQALQGLARAAGGSLTTNPQTGLPEAGFLSSLLPMALGVGLAPFTGGSSLLAAGLVGGGYGLATGNLKKGLLAGLGAYGGAGLGQALGAAGASGAGAASSVGTDIGATSLSDALPAATEAVGGASVPPFAPLSQIGTAAGQSIPAPMATSFSSGVGALPPMTAPISKVGELAGQSIPSQSLTPFISSLPQSGTSAFNAMAPMDKFAAMGRGVTSFDPLAYAQANKLTTAAAFAPTLSYAMKPPKYKEEKEDTSRGTEYDFDPGMTSPFPTPSETGEEERYFSPRYVPRTTSRFAMGGIADGLSSAQSHLGSYSAGGRGRLLRGPGDGVSDSIPATIGGKQPARLADGEFVIPARIVSELGNGSTEAGSRQLYAMMDRIQRARRKTTGKKKVAVNTKAHKLMPA